MKTLQLLHATKRFKIGSLNTQTLNKVYKIPELIASAEITGQDIICIQEHVFMHEDTVIKEYYYDKWKLLYKTTLETTLSASIKYIYFEKACKDAANKVIPLKPKLNKRIPWETVNICQ